MGLTARDELLDPLRQEALVVMVGMVGDLRSPSPGEIRMATDLIHCSAAQYNWMGWEFMGAAAAGAL